MKANAIVETLQWSASTREPLNGIVEKINLSSSWAEKIQV
jgi:hypothetical protein